MSQSFEVQGIIHSIGDTTEYGNNGFTKREFGIKLIGENENPTNPNHAALELIKDKCVVMDNHSIGEEIQRLMTPVQIVNYFAESIYKSL